MKRRNFITLLGGLMTASPLAAHAQQKAMSVVGYLSSASQATYPPAYVAAFRQGLSETGYVEGQNLKIEFRWAEDDYDRLPELAAELVRRKVDAIAATGGLVTALAAKGATATIPIVFTMGDDPVSTGVVASFSRPGGNITGISFFVVELGTKLFGFAAELVADGSPIATLANPNRPSYGPVRKAMEEAASAKGRPLVVIDCAFEKDFDDAFATLARIKAGALVVNSDPLYLDRRERLVTLAAERSIPAVYAWRQYVTAGGLLSYGPSLADAYRQAGADVGKILAGQSPATLPVEQPTKFELVINLKTAKALGLTVPTVLIANADEVIE